MARSAKPAPGIKLVAAPLANDALYDELVADDSALKAPGTIAAAVHSGHCFARDLGEPTGDTVPFNRELAELTETFAMP